MAVASVSAGAEDVHIHKCIAIPWTLPLYPKPNVSCIFNIKQLQDPAGML